MTECYEKYLYGASRILSKKIGIRHDLDLMLFTVNWEPRSIDILNYNSESFSFENAGIITFKSGEIESSEKNNLKQMKLFLKKRIKQEKIKIINERSPNFDIKKFEVINKKIADLIYTLNNTLKRPINIGFDISACPRRIFLSVLGFCLNHAYVKNIIFFYSEGDYNPYLDQFSHSKGDWKLVEIKEFCSVQNPEHKYLYFLSGGWEGGRYANILNRFEPHDLGILLPISGYTEKFSNKTMKECKPIIEQFHIPKTQILKARAGDAILAWKKLQESSINKKKRNIIYLPFGPKPHVLAMGIHAALNKNIFVTYRIPNKGFEKMSISPLENFWEYEIRNDSLI
jgi:hypothetical protein